MNSVDSYWVNYKTEEYTTIQNNPCTLGVATSQDSSGKWRFGIPPNLYMLTTLRETNSPLQQIDAWKTILSFWDAIFSSTFAVSGSVSFSLTNL